MYELVGGKFIKQHNTYICPFDPDLNLLTFSEFNQKREFVEV